MCPSFHLCTHIMSICGIHFYETATCNLTELAMWLYITSINCVHLFVPRASLLNVLLNRQSPVQLHVSHTVRISEFSQLHALPPSYDKIYLLLDRDLFVSCQSLSLKTHMASRTRYYCTCIILIIILIVLWLAWATPQMVVIACVMLEVM